MIILLLSSSISLLFLYLCSIAYLTILGSAPIINAVFGTFRNSFIASRFSIILSGLHLSKSSIITISLLNFVASNSSAKSFLNSATAFTSLFPSSRFSLTKALKTSLPSSDFNFSITFSGSSLHSDIFCAA